MPKTRVEFWQAKLARNVERDSATMESLSKLGWRALIIWECETRDPNALKKQLSHLLSQ